MSTPGMQGYAWARTPAGELFIVLIEDGKGYIPGVEAAMDFSGIDILEPVKWPAASLWQAPPKPHLSVVMRDIADDGEVANAD
jgi:hypothetical protein